MFNLRELFFSVETSKDNGESVRLDGSNMARLINMRLSRAKKCECPRCSDLLSRIHFNGAVTLHEHEGEQKGVRFWTRTYPVDYQAPVGFHLVPTIGEIALEEVHHPAVVIDTLVNAERQWQSADKSSCSDVEGDRFWLNHYKDLARPSEGASSNND